MICRWRGEDELVDVPLPTKIYYCWYGRLVVAGGCCLLRGSVKLNGSRKLVKGEVVAWLVSWLVGYSGVVGVLEVVVASQGLRLLWECWR
jgi:hypothetical protein